MSSINPAVMETLGRIVQEQQLVAALRQHSPLMQLVPSQPATAREVTTVAVPTTTESDDDRWWDNHKAKKRLTKTLRKEWNDELEAERAAREASLALEVSKQADDEMKARKWESHSWASKWQHSSSPRASPSWSPEPAYEDRHDRRHRRRDQAM